MKKARRRFLAALAIAAVAAPCAASAETVFGLSSNRLFSFDSATPGAVSPFVTVTGLLPGTSLVGIDFRPATPGQLVGVGLVGTSGSVYEISTLTGAATLINSGFTLTGTAFGVDFNPVANALRLVSNADQNLRIVTGGSGAVNVDTPLNPGDPSVVGAAYSNNVAGGVGGQTTLYVIDSGTDQLLTQGTVNFPPGTSPNTGTLSPVGALGFNTSDLVGFDISSFTGVALASFTPVTGAASSLFSINLSTGAATLVGSIGGGIIVDGIAIANVSSPGALVLVVLGVASAAAATAWRRRSRAVRRASEAAKPA